MSDVKTGALTVGFKIVDVRTDAQDKQMHRIVDIKTDALTVGYRIVAPSITLWFDGLHMESGHLQGGWGVICWL